VAKGVQDKYRSNIQISNFKAVDMKTFGQYVNTNMLEKDGKDVKLKIPLIWSKGVVVAVIV
jgi:hypothetical protein